MPFLFFIVIDQSAEIFLIFFVDSMDIVDAIRITYKELESERSC